VEMCWPEKGKEINLVYVHCKA